MLVAVTEESSSQGGLLADRLDHLFRTVHPKDPGPYTPAEVAEAINVTAGERVISSTYVWQLRTGRRDNPTQKHLSALAEQLSRPVDEDRLGGFLFGVFARSFDEFAVHEGRAGADQGDEVGGVHGAPAVLR